MSGFSSLRLLTAAVLMTCAAGATTLFSQTTAAPMPTGPVNTAPPAPPVDPNAPIAMINGKDINNKFFNDILMQVAGMRVFQEVFDLAIVQQACTVAGLSQDSAEYKKLLEDELTRTLEGLDVKNSDPTKKVERAEREQALGLLLQRQGVTPVEFRLRLETQAGLRALAAGRITVSDDEVHEAWQAQYGERRQIRLIPVKDDKQAADIRAGPKSRTRKKSMDDIAKEFDIQIPSWTISKNAKDKSIEDIINAANITLTKEGQLSAAVSAAGANGQKQDVLVYLDKIDADKSTVAGNTFDKKKDEVKQQVFGVKEGQWMTNHLATLRAGPRR